ncbi:chaperonin 10-like protein [Amylocarpus encephaloides]|uniref:Chaperonin 10-like protein n=1 Tax=Amylocarpus encephaloides TaxID=45428 RepID=A0A9P7YLK9_9HELO|nr:chaperonin 10-like protein [Amylocarpus encephaloides]
MATTHKAIVTASIRGPLELHDVETPTPINDEIRVKVLFTASTPLDLHQNDGGLLVTHPQVLGDGVAGRVVEVGENVRRLKVGDHVFGFMFREQKEKAHQEFVVAPEWLLGVVPENKTLQQAVTLPNNFVTVFHAVTTDLEIPLPWPKPTSYTQPNAGSPILIWGGSSSVGQFALQILSYYGFSNLLTTASAKHHVLLTSYGARACFDYHDDGCIEEIEKEGVRYVLDCIGSQDRSMRPIARVVGKDVRVAVLLPVVVRDAGEMKGEEPVYEMDVRRNVEWREGVVVRGVRTHLYLDNLLFKEKLQSEIMPKMLEQGIVKPNPYRLIEGETLLERAQKAMDVLRRKEVSGERLVWRVSDDE